MIGTTRLYLAGNPETDPYLKEALEGRKPKQCERGDFYLDYNHFDPIAPRSTQETPGLPDKWVAGVSLWYHLDMGKMSPGYYLAPTHNEKFAKIETRLCGQSSTGNGRQTWTQDISLSARSIQEAVQFLWMIVNGEVKPTFAIPQANPWEDDENTPAEDAPTE